MLLSLHQQTYTQPQLYNPQFHYHPTFSIKPVPVPVKRKKLNFFIEPSWYGLINPITGNTPSYNTLQITARLEYMVINTATGKRTFNYNYLKTFIGKSRDQLRRYCKELAQLGICEITPRRLKGTNKAKPTYVFEFKILDKGYAILGISPEEFTRNSTVLPRCLLRTYIDNNNTSSNEEDIKNIDKDKREKSISKFYKNSNKKEGNTPMRLADIPDLTEEDKDTLNAMAHTNFALNYMNELLKHLARTRTGNRYYHRQAFLNYFAETLANEKRSSDKVNHDSFRMKANLTEEEIKYQQRERELEKHERSNPNVAANHEREFSLNPLESFLNRIVENTAVTPPLITDKPEEKAPEPAKPQKKEPKRISKPLNLTKAMVWANARKELAFDADIPENVHKHWFSKLEAVEDNNKTVITLKADASYTRDWIKNNYFNKIDRACRHHGYELWEITYLNPQTC